MDEPTTKGSQHKQGETQKPRSQEAVINEVAQRKWDTFTKLEESPYLISDYTIRPQSLKQPGTGIIAYRTMEQNRKPRNKPMPLWSINTQQRRQECTVG